jgi:uncharacterized protein GlcG (DUF336 family)
MSGLTCAVASRIVADALAEGRKRGLARLTAAVLDAGGHLVALARDDGSSLLRPQIAVGKAWGVLGMGFGGRELARRAAVVPAFFNALIEMSGGRVVPVAGGVLIRSSAGDILGSLGVTGDTSDNDELCAVAAVTAAGLFADTGEQKTA